MPSRFFKRSLFADRVLSLLGDTEEIVIVDTISGEVSPLRNATWHEFFAVQSFSADGIPMEQLQIRCKCATGDLPFPPLGDPVGVGERYRVRRLEKEYRLQAEPSDNGLTTLILADDY